MICLQHRVDHETLCIPVVTMNRENFAHDSVTRFAFDVDNEIDRLSDLGFGVGECGLRVAAHHQIGEAMKGFFGRVGVNSCERSRVTGIE